MITHEPRSLGYYAASHWIQGAVVFVVIGLLATGLLSALSDAKARAEKQGVELTIRNMRTGLQIAMGEAMTHQREREIAAWVGENPVRWLGSLPAGYRGECLAAERHSLQGGQWCFETTRRELVYRPRNEGQLRPIQTRDASQCCGDLSWRVTKATATAVHGGLVGLRIEEASSCRWFLEGF